MKSLIPGIKYAFGGNVIVIFVLSSILVLRCPVLTVGRLFISNAFGVAWMDTSQTLVRFVSVLPYIISDLVVVFKVCDSVFLIV